MAADWSELLMELLDAILANLPIPDCLAFSDVCSSWRLAFSQAVEHRRLPQSPWLMLPGDTDTTAKFFSLSDHRLHSVTLPPPAIRRRIYVGSSHGWLITAGKPGYMHMLNPVTGAQILLPPITAFSPVPFITRIKEQDAFLVDEERFMSFMRSKPSTRVSADRWLFSPGHMRSYFFQKAVVDKAPSSSGAFTVMLIHNPYARMAFTRAGDTAWTSIQLRLGISDVIHHKGLFHTVGCDGSVEAWHPDATGRSFQPQLIMPRIHEDDDDMVYKKYLAESPSGNLMRVLRCRHWEPEESRTPVKVSVLDEQRRAWIPAAEGIGDAALFIGVNHAMCLSTRDYPGLRANCVYFTDDNLENSSCHKHERRDMGVFDLKDGSIKPIEALGHHLNWPPSVWISPSLS